MIYCFIDESGNPSTKNSEPFYVAMVFIASLDKVNEIKEKIRELKKRNNIPQDYEFHYSRNSLRKRDLFLGFIAKNIEKFKVFRTEKKPGRNVLSEVSNSMANYLSSKKRYRIILDTNPQLTQILKNALRKNKIIAKIAQEKSKNNELIQVADYIAGAASSNIKIR